MRTGVSYTLAAIDHPDTRLALRLTRPAVTVLPALLLFLLVMMSPFDPRMMSVGRNQVIVDGELWRVLTAPFSHTSWRHLLGNLPILMYSCWRVERLFGSGAAALIGAAAVVGSTLFILGMGACDVVGASALAWGFCAAQVVAGIRLGEKIPGAWRRYYGAGTMIPAGALLLLGVNAERVSHLSHMGAIIGGGLAALLIQPETMCPAREERQQRHQLLLMVPVVLLLPMLIPLLPEASREVEAVGTGIRMEIPAWIEGQEIGGMTLWRINPGQNAGTEGAGEKDMQGVFGTLEERAGGEAGAGGRGEWEQRLGPAATAAPLPSPAPLFPGWGTQATMVSTGGNPRWIVVEHRKYLGRWVYRLGYITTANAPRARHNYLRRILQSAEIREPPDLSTTRRAWERNPSDPDMVRAYAQELQRTGDLASALRLLSRLPQTEGPGAE